MDPEFLFNQLWQALAGITVQNLMAFAAGVVLVTLIPGPDAVLFADATQKRGVAAGFAAMAGAFTGLLVHSTLSALGLSYALKNAPTLYLILTIAGAFYLLWMAWGFLSITPRQLKQPTEDLRQGSYAKSAGQTAPLKRPNKAEKQSLKSYYIKGLAINLLNPKILAYFVSFFPRFIDKANPLASYQLFLLGLLFMAIAAPICVALILSVGVMAKKKIINNRIERWISNIFALFLTLLSTNLILEELQY